MTYKEKPGNGLLGYWFITKILFLGVIFFISVGWLPFVIKSDISGIMYGISTGFIALLTLFFLYQIPLVKSHEYTIDDKVHAKAGVISRRERTIDFKKITDVTIHQNIIERMFGIWNLGIQTAGMSGRPEITFIGIKDPKIPEKIIRDKIKTA